MSILLNQFNTFSRKYSLLLNNPVDLIFGYKIFWNFNIITNLENSHLLNNSNELNKDKDKTINDNIILNTTFGNDNTVCHADTIADKNNTDPDDDDDDSFTKNSRRNSIFSNHSLTYDSTDDTLPLQLNNNTSNVNKIKNNNKSNNNSNNSNENNSNENNESVDSDNIATTIITPIKPHQTTHVSKNMEKNETSDNCANITPISSPLKFIKLKQSEKIDLDDISLNKLRSSNKVKDKALLFEKLIQDDNLHSVDNIQLSLNNCNNVVRLDSNSNIINNNLQFTPNKRTQMKIIFNSDNSFSYEKI